MLNLFRRHIQACQYDSRESLKCKCPIWIDWRIAGKRIRRPAQTRDWQIAQSRARQWEAEGLTTDLVPQTIAQACDKFLEDAKARGLREPSIYKYRLLFKQLQAFATERGLVFLSALTVDELRKFRESWPNKNLSARKKLEHLRTFFRFCVDSEWIKSNPAKLIKSPKIDDPPVLPFSDAEMERILDACDTCPDKRAAKRLRAIVLLMRFSGLRIGDACTLPRERIKGGTVELFTAKSGTKVRIPLPPIVIAALEDLPHESGFYFWSGTSKRRTPINIWEDAFRAMFKRANMPEGHSHRLRHTFAVSLLQRGTSMENVSTLLGHKSIRVTERHYSSWVEARQSNLETQVKATWTGTQWAHERKHSSKTRINTA